MTRAWVATRTYDEAGNPAELVASSLVAADSSPDGTGRIADGLAARRRATAPAPALTVLPH